ncbi:MAG TPA: hypothetical protein VFS23_28730 [Vicinamibacterales bacterium]|nr:hypothetical protein [Vicinamibacterales bacterium]
MIPSNRHQGFGGQAPGEMTVRDVIGEPKAWPFCISDDLNGIPDLGGATILHVFTTPRRLLIHLRGTAGSEAMALFYIEDQDVRERTAQALRTATNVVAALEALL